MVRFIHTGDIHIGSSFTSASFGKELSERRRHEIKETFFITLDRCIENDIELLLIAGDLFEENYITMSELKDIKKKFESMNNVQIVICAGNHDAIISETSNYNLINWSDNVHIFNSDISKLTLEALNIDIYSFSWQTKHIKEMDFSALAIDDYSKFNILMLHGDAFNKSNYLPLNVDELLAKGFQYIALGHVHKPEIINDKAAYCGSLEPMDFKESGHHGFIEGIIEGHQVEVKFIPFSKREFIIKEIFINEEMSFEEIKEYVFENIVNDLIEEGMYRIVIKGMKDINVIINRPVLKENLEKVAFYCEIIDETSNNYDIERIKQDNAGNIIEEFIRYMEVKGLDDPQNKDALNVGLSILLREKVD